jgi:NhaP-type Na+/H+ or K+/H+ antiporter
MENTALLFLTLGGLFLAGLVADLFGRRTRLPRVTLLLLIGIAAGPAGLGLISLDATDWFELASTAALALVAFLLGNALTVEKLARHGREILIVTCALLAATMAVMGLGLTLFGIAPGLALVLAALATATDPAATTDAIAQARASGPFTDRLRGIVAVDDASGLIVFSLALVAVTVMGGNGTEGTGAPLREGARELGGSFLVGLATGLPAALLTGRLSRGEPLQSEALGTVFLTAGLAIWLDVSPLLAGITAGAVVANLARHHERAFHEIENVEWPFLLMFFILAGATFDLARVPELGLIGLAYIGLRILSRDHRGLDRLPPGAPAARGMRMAGPGPVCLRRASPSAWRWWPGRRSPNGAIRIVTLTVATTVVFELIGPPAHHDGAQPRPTLRTQRPDRASDLKPLRRRSRKPLRHGLAPCACKFHLGCHAQDLSVVPVGDDQARVLGQKLHRKFLIDRPEIPVGPFQIAAPFPVRGDNPPGSTCTRRSRTPPSAPSPSHRAACPARA